MKIHFFLFILSVLCTTRISAQKATEQKKQVDQINELMNKSYERGLFNGNVLVAKKGKIIYQKSFGFTDETKKLGRF